MLSGGTAVTLMGTNMNSSAVPLIAVTTVLETFNNISDSNGRINIMSDTQVCGTVDILQLTLRYAANCRPNTRYVTLSK